jgi:hypothetical protein
MKNRLTRMLWSALLAAGLTLVPVLTFAAGPQGGNPPPKDDKKEPKYVDKKDKKPDPPPPPKDKPGV